MQGTGLFFCDFPLWATKRQKRTLGILEALAVLGSPYLQVFSSAVADFTLGIRSPFRTMARSEILPL